MNKFFGLIKFFSKVLLLVMLLLVGWVYINFTNLLKGKRDGDQRGDSLDGLLGLHRASADSPAAMTCPHVAYFDGQKFEIENNFLLGRPRSLSRSYAVIRARRERKLISPDLMKFTSTPSLCGGRLTLKLHEIEDREETFISWLKLIRVFHPKNSEVMIDSGFDKFYVVDKAKTEREVVLPSSATLNSSGDLTEIFNRRNLLWGGNSREPTDRAFGQNDVLEFTFRLPEAKKDSWLVFKSMLRGLAESDATPSRTLSWSSFVNHPKFSRALTLLAAALYLAFRHKSFGNALAFVPFMFGTSAPSQSIRFSYRDRSGKYRQFLVHEPRDWRYGIEIIRLPKEVAGRDGTATIKAEFTQRHKLNFIGLLTNTRELDYRNEILPVRRATHSRNGDITEKLSEENHDYAHMVSGDEIEVEFEKPRFASGETEQETYLLQSSGFYMPLRSELGGLIHDWRERASPEAKRYVREMADLRA